MNRTVIALGFFDGVHRGHGALLEMTVRRARELELRGEQADYETILHDIIRRDEQDRNRPVAPLRQAEDAVLVDTTRLNLEESLEALLAAIKERTGR